jgi:hypothetical protein
MEATTSAQQPVGTGSLFFYIDHHSSLARSFAHSLCQQQQQQQQQQQEQQHAVLREGSAQQQATALQAAAAVAAATEQRAILQSQMKTKSQLTAEELHMRKVGCRVASPFAFPKPRFSISISISILSRSVVQRAEASSEERPAADASVE